MLTITRQAEKIVLRAFEKHVSAAYATDSAPKKSEEFRVLNLRYVRGQMTPRRPPRVPDLLPPRTEQMPTDQDWGNVWPGPRSFHPASVPLPVRQGYNEKGAPPGKFANAELMKIPNFLHLTPPVIKRQCEALKKFCTPWPEGLETDQKCAQHFPLEVSFSSYCHSAPTIREPLSRIVTIQVQLAALKLDARAKDKFLRLVGDRYNEETGLVTIVTDRCPTRKQNYDYAMYLLTACYHESLNVEPWENLKSDADMEYYDWEKSASKKSLESLFGKATSEISGAEEYSNVLTEYMNQGENDYTTRKYGDSVRKLLNLPSSI